jgi:hypothetical protein
VVLFTLSNQVIGDNLDMSHGAQNINRGRKGVGVTYTTDAALCPLPQRLLLNGVSFGGTCELMYFGSGGRHGLGLVALGYCDFAWGLETSEIADGKAE